jgi:hypothetical protein
MKRRNLLASAIKALTSITSLASLAGLSTLYSRQTVASYPVAAFRSEKIDPILEDLFDTTQSGEDGAILIQMPLDAESDQRIPFRITARYAEKIAIFAEGNRQPLVLFANTSQYPQGIILGTVDLDQSCNITCYALRQGFLYRKSRWVNLPVPGF